jgi:hypothetical protein
MSETLEEVLLKAFAKSAKSMGPSVKNMSWFGKNHTNKSVHVERKRDSKGRFCK